ncbi:MAG: YciI family protein [Alphaproteobacteria bacterium]
MRQFVITALDKKNVSDLRQQHRDEHLLFLSSAKQWGVEIILAGPLLSGDDMIGSHLVLAATDEMVIKNFLNADPYHQAGLFATTTIYPFKQVLPK